MFHALFGDNALGEAVFFTLGLFLGLVFFPVLISIFDFIVHRRGK